MSTGVRLFTVASISLLVGGAIGSYATSVLLGGGQEPVHPSAAKEPAAPECNCNESDLPLDPVLVDEEIGEGLTEVETPALPGLPVSALNRARAEAQRQLQPCLTSSTALGQGTIVLTLTVTATGGQGFIRQADVTARAGDTDWAEACVLQQAGAVRFEWPGSDGEQTLKLPVRVGL